MGRDQSGNGHWNSIVKGLNNLFYREEGTVEKLSCRTLLESHGDMWRLDRMQ